MTRFQAVIDVEGGMQIAQVEGRQMYWMWGEVLLKMEIIFLIRVSPVAWKR